MLARTKLWGAKLSYRTIPCGTMDTVYSTYLLMQWNAFIFDIEIASWTSSTSNNFEARSYGHYLSSRCVISCGRSASRASLDNHGTKGVREPMLTRLHGTHSKNPHSLTMLHNAPCNTFAHKKLHWPFAIIYQSTGSHFGVASLRYAILISNSVEYIIWESKPHEGRTILQKSAREMGHPYFRYRL